MKKLKLKALSLGAVELLSRNQMKNVVGGDFPPPSGCLGPNGCLITDCTAQSGPCKGHTGTCGAGPNGSCPCAVICAGD